MNNNNFKLIREFNEDILTESYLEEGTGKKSWTISGITLQSELQNKNKRVYPKIVLSEAVNIHITEQMKNNRALGELNHPTGNNSVSHINLDRVSHKFIEVIEDGNNFICKAKVLDTPCGKIVANLLEADVKLGISSRGLGKIKVDKGVTLVEKLHLVSLGDIVGTPSAPNAYINGILESVEFEMLENGFIQKDVNDKIDKYYTKIKEYKNEDIQKAITSIFKDYLNNIIK